MFNISSFSSISEFFLLQEAYQLLDRLSRYAPLLIVNFEGESALHFASILFKLLETEVQYGGDLTAPLFSALGGVRIAYAAHLSGMQDQNARLLREHQLISLLKVARSSRQSKKRLAVLHWSKSLFEYRNSIVLESMIVLAGDPVDAVSMEALESFRDLRGCLSRMMHSSETRGDTTNQPKSNSVSAIHSLENIFSSLLLVETVYPSCNTSGGTDASAEASRSQHELQVVSVIQEEVFATASTTLEVFLYQVQKECLRANINCSRQLPLLAPDDWLVLPSHISAFLRTCQQQTSALGTCNSHIISLPNVTQMMKLLAFSSDPSAASLSSLAAGTSTSPASPRQWKTSSSLLPDRLESIQAPLLVEKVRLLRHCVAVAAGYTLWEKQHHISDVSRKDKHMQCSSPQTMGACDFGRVVLTPLLLHWLGSASDGEMSILECEGEGNSKDEKSTHSSVPSSKISSSTSPDINMYSGEGGLRRSSQSHIAQTLGYLCMRASGPLSFPEGNVDCGDSVRSSHYLSQIWCILQHKLDSDSARAGRGALRCMTSIVEVLSVECQHSIEDDVNVNDTNKLIGDAAETALRSQLAINYAADLVSFMIPMLAPHTNVVVESPSTTSCLHRNSGNDCLAVNTPPSFVSEDSADSTANTTSVNTKLNSTPSVGVIRETTESTGHSPRHGHSGKVVMRPAEEHAVMLRGVALSCVAALASRKTFSVPDDNERESHTEIDGIYCRPFFSTALTSALQSRKGVHSISSDRVSCEVLLIAMLDLIPLMLNQSHDGAEKKHDVTSGDGDRNGLRQRICTFSSCMLIRAISQICASSVPRDLFMRCWSVLLAASSHLRETAGGAVLRFSLAEGLIRMSLSLPGWRINDCNSSERHVLPPLMLSLFHHVETRVSLSSLPPVSAPDTASGADTVVTEHERSFCGILLLVWLKQLQEWSHLHLDFELLSADILTRSCVSFLLLIRGRHVPKFSNHVNNAAVSSDSPAVVNSIATSGRLGELGSDKPSLGQPEPFLQDVCCTGLCIAYNVSSSRDGGNYVSDKISSLVISTLCREKKAIQPAGVATAGESTQRETLTDSSDSVMQQTLDRLERTIPLPEGGGGGGDTGDILAAAAARAQEALNIYHATGSSDDTGTTSNIQQGHEEDYNYGVYTKICKVAKKAGK